MSLDFCVKSLILCLKLYRMLDILHREEQVSGEPQAEVFLIVL